MTDRLLVAQKVVSDRICDQSPSATVAGTAWSRLAARQIVVVAVGVISVAFFFRYQIANGFTLLSGDRYDGFIEIAILEHWYNVVRGFSHWSQMNYFYPVAGSLGYNDGYFLYGLIYACFRGWGLDPFLSGELVNVVVRSIGFFAFYLALRRIFELPWRWALLAAVLFTISNNSFIHILHAQLLSVSFAPLLAVLGHGALMAFMSGQRRALLLWGTAFNCLFSACLMTGFYMGWFFAFLTSAMLLIWMATAGTQSRKIFMNRLRTEVFPLAILLCIAIVTNIPFMSVYLPKAAETGMHRYEEVLQYSPSLLDVVHVGNNNFLFGRLQAIFSDYLRPDFPTFSERTTGFPPVILLVFLGGVASFLFQISWRDGGRASALAALAMATLGTWILTLHIKQWSVYYFVYLLFPGAKAVRVIARYQIFLAAPVIALAMFYLSENAHRIAKIILIPLCVLLVIEEINIGAPLSLNRVHELAWLDTLPLAPVVCRSFFVSAGRQETFMGPAIDGILSHNIDAMLIAETKRLPTINGASTFLPPDWRLENPALPGYRTLVDSVVARYELRGLCALDLQTVRWELH